VALVTGAASGIGKATAARFAAEGAKVVIADIDEAGAGALADSINAKGGAQAVAMRFDAGEAADCEQTVRKTVERFGKLDVLVNNAGIMDWGKAEEYDDARFERVIRVNLGSVFRMSKHALPHLEKSGGCIVNISSSSALSGVPFACAYSASKAGINGLMRSMAAEFAQRGVRINSVCPGAVDTPLNTKSPIPSWADVSRLQSAFPKTGKFSDPDEIAGAILYLASADARNVIGITLSVDGGQTL
jgi:meso-butanediol dehydrogenase/(S,S)-butanediol dehydrogenase/diacetyl reductase